MTLQQRIDQLRMAKTKELEMKNELKEYQSIIKSMESEALEQIKEEKISKFDFLSSEKHAELHFIIEKSCYLNLKAKGIGIEGLPQKTVEKVEIDKKAFLAMHKNKQKGFVTRGLVTLTETTKLKVLNV